LNIAMRRTAGGFGIAADLVVDLRGLQDEQAPNLAHPICPYSHATRDRLDVGQALAQTTLFPCFV